MKNLGPEYESEYKVLEESGIKDFPVSAISDFLRSDYFSKLKQGYPIQSLKEEIAGLLKVIISVRFNRLSCTYYNHKMTDLDIDFSLVFENELDAKNAYAFCKQLDITVPDEVSKRFISLADYESLMQLPKQERILAQKGCDRCWGFSFKFSF